MKHPTHYTTADDIELCARLTQIAQSLPAADAVTLREAEGRLQCLSGTLMTVKQLVMRVKG